MIKAPNFFRNKREQGFTLIETMVALIVLSVGLLGIAAMQYKGLQSAHSAHHRAMASIIAMDAAERLWLRVAQGDVNDPNVINVGGSSIQELWLTHWSGVLPGLTGSISDDFLITVTWDECRFLEAGQTCADDGTSSFEYQVNFLPDIAP